MDHVFPASRAGSRAGRGGPRQQMPLLELGALMMTGWAVYMYAVSFALQLSGHMLPISTLRMVVFGPGVVALAVFGLYRLFVRSRHLARALAAVAVIGVVLSACAPLTSGGSGSICQKVNSYCLSGSPTP